MADSYLKQQRIVNSVRHNRFLLNFPHSNKEIKVTNLSRGSLTFKALGEDKELILSWVRSKPQVTLLHIGACDLVNGTIDVKVNSIKNTFIDIVEKSIENLKSVAKEHLKDYEQWAQTHKFVVCQVPDWGKYAPRRKSLDPATFKTVRRIVNHGLKKKRGLLWAKKDILTVHPETQYPHMVGVHYDEITQMKYCDEIFEVVNKLLCEHCRPTQDASTKSLGQLRVKKCQQKSNILQ